VTNEVIGCIARTPLVARLDIPGYLANERTAKLLAKTLGPRGVLVGAIPDQLAMVQLIADKETDKHLTDAEWRDLNLLGSGTDWKYFESGGMLCGEVAIQMEGSGSHDFHAFTVRGGYRFDLHLSESLTSKHGSSIPRERFDQLTRSFRLGLVRLGSWNQMPTATLDLMDSTLKHSDDWKSWIDEQAKARPQDYAVPFTMGEFLRLYDTQPKEQISAYTRATELLAAKKDRTAPERLVHAASEDGLALALLDAGDAEKALPHLDRSDKIAEFLTPTVRAEVRYDRARVVARLGRIEEAFAILKESELTESGAFARAANDKYFEEVRKTKGFQDLLDGDRTNH
jgi:hypothetical protein